VVHLVLHQQNRHLGRQAADQRGDTFALGGGESHQWLVKQEDPRARGQRNADFEQALPAVGKTRHRHPLETLEPEITLKSVVLPAPFGPISACSVRSATRKLARSTATKAS
jgi:hypothetical protein